MGLFIRFKLINNKILQQIKPAESAWHIQIYLYLQSYNIDEKELP